MYPSGIRKFPCCMCPAVSSDFQKDVCPDCDFKVSYENAFEKKRFVKKGGPSEFFITNDIDCFGTFFEAQEVLNALADSKGWKRSNT